MSARLCPYRRARLASTGPHCALSPAAVSLLSHTAVSRWLLEAGGKGSECFLAWDERENVDIRTGRVEVTGKRAFLSEARGLHVSAIDAASVPACIDYVRGPNLRLLRLRQSQRASEGATGGTEAQSGSVA